MIEPVNRPPGDLLEELLTRGSHSFAGYVTKYPGCQSANRAAILLGGLAFGPATLESLAEWATKPDSGEKWSVMVGLAAMGHPEVEGYFLRYLREGRADRQTVTAIEALAQIKSAKSREFLLKLIEEPFLFAACANALVTLDPKAAAGALMPHAERWEAIDALSRTGFGGARPLFQRLLSAGEPMCLAAINGLARIGEAEDAERVALCITAKSPDLARAAFEAYARMGAPLGPEPLLKAARKELKPWMIEPLGLIDDGEARDILLKTIESSPAKSLLKKVIFWKEEAKADPAKVFEALRNSADSETLLRVTARLKAGGSRHELRALLKIGGLYRQSGAEAALLDIFKGGDLAAAYLVADGWLGSPSREFLITAIRSLRKPGFTELDNISAILDPQHLIESRAAEVNPCLLIGSFLDSGLIDVSALVDALSARFAAKKFPASIAPRGRFSALEEGGFGPFLEALYNAHTPIREELSRIWEVLLEVKDDGAPVFELFWCETGLHRGGLQRMILRRLADGVEKWTQGEDDKFLSEIDVVESTIPRDGPLAVRVLKVFEEARGRLMRECKDMVVWMEGGQRGDMVLIEKL